MKRILVFLFAGIVSVGVLGVVFTFTGHMPDTKAVIGEKLPTAAKVKLIESGLVGEGESIEYFYSEAMLSFVEFGNFFTDTRVVSYELDEETNERVIYSATYDEISDLEFEKSTDILEDSLIYVYQDGVWSFALVVSNEADGDVAFYNKLAQMWKANRGNTKQVEASLENY